MHNYQLELSALYIAVYKKEMHICDTLFETNLKELPYV